MYVNYIPIASEISKCRQPPNTWNELKLNKFLHQFSSPKTCFGVTYLNPPWFHKYNQMSKIYNCMTFNIIQCMFLSNLLQANQTPFVKVHALKAATATSTSWHRKRDKWQDYWRSKAGLDLIGVIFSIWTSITLSVNICVHQSAQAHLPLGDVRWLSLCDAQFANTIARRLAEKQRCWSCVITHVIQRCI